MNLFNQIVPRLTRPFARQQDEGCQSGGSAGVEFAVKPVYALTESPEAWGLTAHLPGVTKEGLELTAEDGQVTVRGRRGWQKPEAWTAVYRESLDAPYELTLEHDNTVDTDRIQAELKDGVLRVTLPKAESVKPRKITVN